MHTTRETTNGDPRSCETMPKRVGYAAKGTGLPILGQPTTYCQVTPPHPLPLLTVHAIRQEEIEHRSSRDGDPHRGLNGGWGESYQRVTTVTLLQPSPLCVQV